MTDATHYNGATQYATRSGGLAGIADSKQLLLSMWFHPENVAAGLTRYGLFYYESHIASCIEVQYVDAPAGVYPAMYLSCANGVNYTFQTAPDFAGRGVPVRNAWNHLLWSFNVDAGLGGPVGHAYLNDTDISGGGIIMNDRAVPYTSGTPLQKIVGFTDASWTASQFIGCRSEVFFDTSYLDLSIVGNRRKFISAGGETVDLGVDGSTPLGYQPLLYISDGKIVNVGTGGDLTAAGAPPACGSAPPAPAPAPARKPRAVILEQ